MAESKGSLIAKSVQKHAGRAKEKLLQNLGKVDRTLDDIFEEHMQNFNHQHLQAVRLQKEFNNYIRCIRAVQTASKSLMEAITEVYESGWSGHDLLYMQSQNMEMLWQDFSHKLGDQVLIPLNTYTNQFPEVKKKIEKRGRKLVDYDSQRHSFQNLQSNAAKRRDDVKVTKGREQLEEAKRTYEVLNSELHDELPALYDSRVLFYVNNFQTLFSAEQLFHSESSKVFAELEAITDKLATDSQRGSYTNTSKKAITNNISPLASPLKSVHNGNAPSPLGTMQSESREPMECFGSYTPTDTPTHTNGHNGSSNIQTDPSPQVNGGSPPPTPARAAPEDKAAKDLAANGNGDIKEHLYDIPAGPPSPIVAEKDTSVAEKDTRVAEKDTSVAEKDTSVADTDTTETITTAIETKETNVNNNAENTSDKRAERPERERQLDVDKTQQKEKKSIEGNTDTKEEVYDIPVGATLSNLPAGTLYRVRATYRYTREDSDELSFDVGDVIRVVQYDDPEEQEEGWLMGIKETTNEKGMFPANFTRPI